LKPPRRASRLDGTRPSPNERLWSQKPPLSCARRDQIDAAIKAAEDKFDRIDVLVNNAGIGYFAAVEESEEDQVRRMFEINVFGLSRMIHAALPGMRKRRKGFIVNFSSIGGLRSFPSVGYYNATKFAVEGLSEALWQEVEPLGIKVMLVEPSGFRTDYAATAGAWRSQVRATSGKQPGDPVRASHAIVKAIESPNPPHHLLLGNDAYEAATAKIEELRKQFSAWEAVSRRADFPKEKQG
jgi:NAD(P)-dependent dehydrogenase (short-subunit alcohol dehydrogenase family)